MVALLRPLTKHPDLRKCILTNDVLEDLVALFDDIVTQLKENFGQAMDGLHCLLECSALLVIVHVITHSLSARGDPALSRSKAWGQPPELQSVQTFSDIGSRRYGLHTSLFGTAL